MAHRIARTTGLDLYGERKGGVVNEIQEVGVCLLVSLDFSGSFGGQMRRRLTYI